MPPVPIKGADRHSLRQRIRIDALAPKIGHHLSYSRMLGNCLRSSVAVEAAETHEVAFRCISIGFQQQVAAGCEINAAGLKYVHRGYDQELPILPLSSRQINYAYPSGLP